MVRRRNAGSRTVLLLTSYSILLLVSLFANLLVCHVVLRTRRLHTLTNTFLANLAASDLVMTTMNIPFSVARVLLDNWPFGAAMCCLVPFVQVASVYVSSFTMAAIAIDRYQVIMRPLQPRMGATHGAVIIGVIWAMASLLALPYAVFNQVVEVFTFTTLERCQPRYPSPSLVFRRWLTLATFLTQYVLPLTLTMMAYTAVVRKIWWTAAVGVSSRQQATLRIRSKKKTVKMLLVVVILFAVCWLPLNTYHLVVDFSAPVGPSRHSSTVFFLCHWLAMSSVCYNPFIYCWLNDNFRAGARAWLSCAGRKMSYLIGCLSRRNSQVEDEEGVFDKGASSTGAMTNQTTNLDVLSSSSSAITCVPLSVGHKAVRSSIKSYSRSNYANNKSSSIKSFNKSGGSVRIKETDVVKYSRQNIHIPLKELLTGESVKRKDIKKTTRFFKKRSTKKKPRKMSLSSSSLCSTTSVKKQEHQSSSSGSYPSYSSQSVYSRHNADGNVKPNITRKKNIYRRSRDLEGEMQQTKAEGSSKLDSNVNECIYYESSFIYNKYYECNSNLFESRDKSDSNSCQNPKKSLSFNNKDCSYRQAFLNEIQFAPRNKTCNSKWHLCHFLCKSDPKKYANTRKINTLHSSLMFLDRNFVNPPPNKSKLLLKDNPNNINSFLNKSQKSDQSKSQFSATFKDNKIVAMERTLNTDNDCTVVCNENDSSTNQDQKHYQNNQVLYLNKIYRQRRRHSAPSQSVHVSKHRKQRKYKSLGYPTRRSNVFKFRRHLGSQETHRYLSVSAPLLDTI